MGDPGSDDVLVHRILDEVEDQTGIRWEAEGRFPRGTRGAWRVRGPEGPAVLKFDLRGDVGEDVLRRSSRISAVLQRGGAPVPGYLAVGSKTDLPQWSIIERMPGSDAELSPQLADQMVAFTARQARRGPILAPGTRNWTRHINDELFGSREMSSIVAGASPEGRALVEQVDAAVAGLEGRVTESRDIVHGDFQHYNALQDSRGNLSAVIDWDGAGCGDRGIDIARLRMDASLQKLEGDGADPEIVQRLGEAVTKTSGPEALTLFSAYYAIQVAEFALRALPDRAHEYIRCVSDSLEQVTRGVAAPAPARHAVVLD
jgi:hypothetical protein